MSLANKNEYGKILIADQVIATIAGRAALESYGLIGMASQKLQDGIGQLLGMDSLGKGIVVHSKGELIIDVYVIMAYGTKISQIAQNVMEQVRYAVEQTTGQTVGKVNVIVQGVRVLD
ncbi:MAG: Asp23/Gls24 family envelope stress response protein [Bacillota bacterium]